MGSGYTWPVDGQTWNCPCGLTWPIEEECERCSGESESCGT